MAKIGEKVGMQRFFGSMPWLKLDEKQRLRAKVFRSGNSLAVRIPAGTRLVAGMEMDLTIENGEVLIFEPIVSVKPKFNIAKVAGSARTLKPLDENDRWFDERPLDRMDSARGGDKTT